MIDEVKAALEGITPLPWTADEYEMFILARGTKGGGFRTMVADDGGHDSERRKVARVRGWGAGEPQERNLHAIATVMNAAPSMVAEIERLQEENAYLKSARFAELTYVTTANVQDEDVRAWARSRLRADLIAEQAEVVKERERSGQ